MESRPVLERLFSLEGRVALVTGASGGIGRALALALSQAGAAIALQGRDENRLAAVREEIESGGGRGESMPADLSDLETCASMIESTVRKLGHLDVLVNCAGTNRRKPIANVTPDDFDSIVGVNLRSLYFLTRAALPHLRAANPGKVIHIGSMTTSTGLGGVSVYGMTKSALGQLTKTMAIEWAPYNIQVNCLAPGFIRTPLTEAGLFNDPRRTRWILDRIPAGREGLPEDLIGTAIFLASAASNYMTGQIVSVDGGYLAGGSWLRSEEQR